VQLKKERFARQIQRLVRQWRDGSWRFDALLVVTGKTSDGAVEFKSTAMHHWLLGIEFPETAVALLSDGRVAFLASAKKIEYLRQVQSKDVELFARPSPSTAASEAQVFQTFLSFLGKSAVGMLQKEKHEGVFAANFLQSVAQVNLRLVECRDEVSSLLALRDAEELEYTKQASLFSCLAMSDVFVRQVEEIIDRGTTMKNSEIATKIEEEIENQEHVQLWQEKHGLDPQDRHRVRVVAKREAL